MSKVSSYTSWQPLEEVIVGRAYTPDYFDFIDNAQVREQLQLILDSISPVWVLSKASLNVGYSSLFGVTYVNEGSCTAG